LLYFKIIARVKNRILFREIIMRAMQVNLAAIIIMMILCQISGAAQEKPASPTVSPAVAEVVPLNPQQDLNKDTLLKNSEEQKRVTAANLLLIDTDPNARKVLIDTLGLSNNSAARMAVCRALVQARSSSQSVANIEVFIQPLLGVFSTENADEAKQAAQATLIYSYAEIGQSLENLATDNTKPVTTRLNAIGALQIQPDVRAAIKLLQLVDDTDKQIADRAEKSLLALGIPSGANKEDRSKTINSLIKDGTYKYMQTLLVTRSSEIRQLNTELSSWKTYNLELLNKIYLGYDDTAKGKFLIDNLGNTRPEVKRWALDKVKQWRETNPNLPGDLSSILISLISDADKDVRLKTAELISIIGELNPAPMLLARLKVETNDEVKNQLVDTLGMACYNVLGQAGKIAPEIRTETLDWGSKFLAEQDVKKAQIGVKVITNFLEKDELNPEEVDKYLKLLSERYQQQKDNPTNNLRIELINAMTRLVAQKSDCRTQAGTLFQSVFQAALQDKSNLIREAAVTGLIYKDNVAALKILRQDAFINDPSEVVRGKIIQLAQEIGSREDLTWLVGKTDTASEESKSAWQAILRIFNDLDAVSMQDSVNRLTSTGSQNSLSVEQKIVLLEKYEAKATGENRADMLKSSRERLAELYSNTSKFDKAAEYYNKLSSTAKTPEDSRIFLPRLVEAYLRLPNIQQAMESVKKYLTLNDLDAEDSLVRSIDNYLINPPAGVDPNSVLKSLIAIDVIKSRPKWRRQLETWSSRLGQIRQ
jgi:tetratricopeptide (TPR) repeat protein